ncbi:OmpA family protein [Lignipirellula cremea]|uniref:OmpA family protein n=1 Tax=Lignipirellula cremea TaxID=2528010 RepID=A0A518DZ95_9BACT|nr:OmpA family protein [Lignipirellula cremea]QDU97166.1 OmpA family protein [Lignipirellula cremea]
MPLRLILLACAVAPFVGCGMFKKDTSGARFQVERQQLINRVNAEMQLKQELELANRELNEKLAEAEKEVARYAMQGGGNPSVQQPQLEQLAAQSPSLTYSRQERLARFQDDIAFAPGQAELDAAGRASLDQLVGLMQQPHAQGSRVVIASEGNDASGQSRVELGAGRAAAVAAYLRQRGLTEENFGGLSITGGPAAPGSGRVALYLAEPNAPVIASQLGTSLFR